jgi:hypothetical protein
MEVRLEKLRKVFGKKPWLLKILTDNCGSGIPNQSFYQTYLFSIRDCAIVLHF